MTDSSTIVETSIINIYVQVHSPNCFPQFDQSFAVADNKLEETEAGKARQHHGGGGGGDDDYV